MAEGPPSDSSPVLRSRQRATGVLGQLWRMFNERAGMDISQGAQARAAGASSAGPTTRAGPRMHTSPALLQALRQPVPGVSVPVGAAAAGPASTQQASTVQMTVALGGAKPDTTPLGVVQMAAALREHSASIKKKAVTDSEKATIEVVALMFQSILAEERIPSAVRVWFARLQMPVLRVALAEPEFFGTLQHPARNLIDHMGACVLGFDAAAIGGSALESEIRRVVQVIEQYPDTGRRVFQLVYDEFQKFLSKYLTEKGPAQRVVSVAQQVEQRETLTVQYTIEMRNMLSNMPVRNEIRDFLFKVWAEVLALAAVKHGPQDEETLAYKKAASALVWASGSKPNRSERARVIQELPKLLQRLRQGMTLLGVSADDQEAHIKLIGDTLADAFMSKTATVPQESIDEMAKRLANLEDFVLDDEMAEIPLDAASIEMMVGIDASELVVVADGSGSATAKPNNAMLAWAQELQRGTWFSLDHNGKVMQVQYVWQSERKQLHLFAAVNGVTFLIQLRRMAAYLQAGLLVPQEEEALTVRATREALAKIDANPERLLG